MIEITTIGAGGGSIAHVDKGGLLQVGPESAGSRPGPACYGAGGERPTLTDANVVLGRINAERPIGGGRARLDVEAAKAAIVEHVGDAAGPRRRRGRGGDRSRRQRAHGRRDPARLDRARPRSRTIFALMPFGGGGALHAGALIGEVGLVACDRAALSRHHQRARLRDRGSAARSGADRQSDARRARRCGAGRAAWSTTGARSRKPWSKRAGVRGRAGRREL